MSAVALTPLQIAEKARAMDLENLSKYGAKPCVVVEIKEELDNEGTVHDREEKKTVLNFSSLPIPGGREVQRISPQASSPRPEEDVSVLDYPELFDWKLEGEDESQGEPCYRLGFRPKHGAKPYGARLAVLSQSRGLCWVAKSDFSKIRLEGRLTKPLELMGFFVKVREVDFLTTAKRVGQGVAAPLQVRYRFFVEAFPFWELHERHTQSFDFHAGSRSWPSSQNQKGGVAGLK